MMNCAPNRYPALHILGIEFLFCYAEMVGLLCADFFRKGQITVFAKQTKSKKERSKERVNSKTVLFLVPLFCRLKTAEHLFVGWFSYSYTQKGS